MHTRDRHIRVLPIFFQECGHDDIYPVIKLPDLQHAGAALDFQRADRQLQCKITQPVEITVNRMFQQVANRLSAAHSDRSAQPLTNRMVDKIEERRPRAFDKDILFSQYHRRKIK